MLDEETKNDLLYLSQVTNKSMSELVRSFVAEKVQKEKKKMHKRSRSKKINAISELLELAKQMEVLERKRKDDYPTDVSFNIDHYLYGAPKRKHP